MTGLTVLLVGIPATLFRLARRRHERQQAEQLGAARGDCWQGFIDARLNHPPLAELEIR